MPEQALSAGWRPAVPLFFLRRQSSYPDGLWSVFRRFSTHRIGGFYGFLIRTISTENVRHSGISLPIGRIDVQFYVQITEFRAT